MTRRSRRRHGGSSDRLSAQRPKARNFRQHFRRKAHFFTPPGLAGRIILLVIGIIILVQIFGWLFSGDGWEIDDPQEVATEQVIAITHLLDRTPVQEREVLIEALNGIALLVKLDDEAARVSDPDHLYAGIKKEIREDLADLGDRSLEIALRGGWDRDSALLLSVQLEDKSWVIFAFPFRAFALYDESGSGIGSAIFWLLIIGAVFWFSNRLARPLRVFADAAERLGRDVNTTPLPVSGSREIRRATRAFNEMQLRIQRMIDDRALMLAAIAHDLRTVLTRLRLRAEFIEDEEQQAKAAADIEEMQAMLDSGLAFARGETEVETRRTVDMALLVRDIAEDVARTNGPTSYAGAEHLMVHCGPNEMRRAISNLICNAVAYGRQADVSLTSNAENIQLSISDKGPGIPLALHEQVFQPFFRVENSRNRETGGTGLGLAIARTIARRHGGDITLTNRPEGGLTVLLTLPKPRD